MLNFVAKSLLSCAVLALVNASAVAQTQIEVTVTTTGPVGLAPAFAAFHDGGYDIFDGGGMATAGLQILAEVGDPSTIVGEATATGATAGGFAPGGPFAPGGASASELFTVDNSQTSFAFAQMVLPSNDWFIGTMNSIDISSLIGAPAGTSQEIVLSTVYDAGTELEDFAFAPGGPLVGITTASNPAGGTETTDPISVVDGADPFASFANLEPASFDTTTIDFTGGSIATVTLRVVPEPASMALAGMGVVGLCGLIRRRR